jgi:hypothetical protein
MTMNMARLSVEAPSTTQIGELFQVNITVTGVVDLQGWQIVLYFNRSVLSALNITEGPFLKSAGETIFLVGENGILNDYNATHGRIMAGAALLGYNWISGDGVLLTAKFNGTSIGSSFLTLGLNGSGLWYTQLIDKDDNEIPFDFIPNSITVIPEFSALSAMPLFLVSSIVIFLGKRLLKIHRNPKN